MKHWKQFLTETTDQDSIQDIFTVDEQKGALEDVRQIARSNIFADIAAIQRAIDDGIHPRQMPEHIIRSSESTTSPEVKQWLVEIFIRMMEYRRSAGVHRSDGARSLNNYQS